MKLVNKTMYDYMLLSIALSVHTERGRANWIRANLGCYQAGMRCEAQIQDVKQKDEIKWSKDKISGLISSLENFEKSTNKNFDETTFLRKIRGTSWWDVYQ